MSLLEFDVMKKRVLFVDDDPNILTILRQLLSKMSSEWDVQYAAGGKEALDIMSTEPVDVLVTDLRMPGISGSQLLTEVERLYPQTVRLVFSGVSDLATVYEAVEHTHQYLAKPADITVLRDTVAHLLSMRSVLSSDSLKNVVNQIETLPSLPDMYYELVNELNSSEPSTERIGGIIQQDPAMCAKVLQLVNSAFFGIRQRVTDPMQAATLIGLKVLRSLVLAVHIFTKLEEPNVTGFAILDLWNHSINVAVSAQDIAVHEEASRTVVEESFVAGLLHDVGKLVLAMNLGDHYGEVLAQAGDDIVLLPELERKNIGATHAEVGAYLLGLWGFSDTIVNAVAYHHNPQESGDADFSALTSVYIANMITRSAQKNQYDTSYLSQPDLEIKLSEWRDVCVGVG